MCKICQFGQALLLINSPNDALKIKLDSFSCFCSLALFFLFVFLIMKIMDLHHICIYKSMMLPLKRSITNQFHFIVP